MASRVERLPVDLADVKTVLDLEAPLRTMFEQIAAAEPALTRLEEARYPGADEVRVTMEYLVFSNGLERMRIGAGDQAAIDYHEFIVERGLSIDEAAEALVDRSRNAARLDAFLQYAKVKRR